MKNKVKAFVSALLLSVMLAVPAVAAEPSAVPAGASEAELYHVTDITGNLTSSEIVELEAMAQAIEDEKNFGVYAVVVDDYRDFSGVSVFDAACTIYEAYSLGVGPDKDGLMLLLSMDDRDYSLITYGERGEYAFNDEGRIEMTDFFLDDFADDDWYAGFADYMEWAGLYLEAADAGEPYSYSNPPMDDSDILFGIAVRIAAILLLPLVLAIIVVRFLSAKMESVAQATQATEYVAGGLQLTSQYDTFSHTTEVVERIESSDSPRTSSGGGFSGTSGKF